MEYIANYFACLWNGFVANILNFVYSHSASALLEQVQLCSLLNRLFYVSAQNGLCAWLIM